MRPDDDQRGGDRLARRAGRRDLRTRARRSTAAVDRLFSENQVDATYADDVEPWLGDEAAVFVRSFESRRRAQSVTPDFAAMVEVDDADAARDSSQRVVDEDPAPEEQRSYEGTDYYASRAGTSPPGSSTTTRSCSAPRWRSRSPSTPRRRVAGRERGVHATASRRSPDDALGSAFFEPAGLIARPRRPATVDPGRRKALEPLLGGALSQPIAATLSATADSRQRRRRRGRPSRQTDMSTESVLLDGLPAGAWFAAAVPDLGPTLKRTLDQLSNSGLPGAGELERQVRERHRARSAATTSSAGSATRRSSSRARAPPAFTAGLIAQTSDPQAPRSLLERGSELAERDSGLRSSGPAGGRRLRVLDRRSRGSAAAPRPGWSATSSSRCSAARSPRSLDPGETLGDDERFQAAVDALGDDLAPVLYLDLPSFFEVAAEGDPTAAPTTRRSPRTSTPSARWSPAAGSRTASRSAGSRSRWRPSRRAPRPTRARAGQ